MRILLIVLLLFPVTSFAKSSVWEVSKGGKHLYLAGTMHLLKQEDYPLPREYDYAYKHSRMLVFETDLQALMTPEFQQKLMQQAMYPKGESIASVLKPELLTRLQKFCSERQLALEPLLGMKAGMLVTTLSMVEAQRYGLAQEGVDNFYYQRAKKDGKPISGLETAEQQLGFIANMGKGNENALLRQTLDDMDTLPQMIASMRKIWRQGDVAGMANELVTPMQADYPKLYIELLAQRNVNWIPYIEAMMQTSEVEMVLVGAAHMAGEHGLHNLLRARGYTVKQINPPI